MKKSLLLMLLMLISIASFSQNRKITGLLTDRDTKEPLLQTTVQLLKMDSTFVTGAISNEQGVFAINAPSNGRYLLKISIIGYKTTFKRIEIAADKDLDMGGIVLGADAVMLKGATVLGHAAKVILKEDTFI